MNERRALRLETNVTPADVLAPLLGITVPLIAIGALIWRLSSKISGIDQRSLQAAADAHAAKEASSKAAGAVGDLRQELARDYVRAAAVESRMQRIEERIDDLPGRIVTLMQASPSLQRSRRRRADDE